MHHSPYVCINEPFTARSVNLQGGDFLSVDVAGIRDTCVPLSTKKTCPFFLSTTAREGCTDSYLGGQRGMHRQLMPLSSVGLCFSLPLIVAGWYTRICILTKLLVLPTNRLLLDWLRGTQFLYPCFYLNVSLAMSSAILSMRASISFCPSISFVSRSSLSDVCTLV